MGENSKQNPYQSPHPHTSQFLFILCFEIKEKNANYHAKGKRDRTDTIQRILSCKAAALFQACHPQYSTAANSDCQHPTFDKVLKTFSLSSIDSKNQKASMAKVF